MPDEKVTVTLPSHEFYYTLDQIALILSVEEPWLRGQVYFAGRMPDAHPRNKLLALNIADASQRPKWRVPHREFIRWLARKGYKPAYN